MALVEKTSQRGIADDRDLEFLTWVARISSNCEIETRETRETETERIHTERERGIEEEEKVGFVVAEEKRREERETSKWWVFCFCWGSSKRSSKKASRQQIERRSREIHSSYSSSSEVCGVFFLFFLLFLFARELPCKNEFLVTKPNPVFFS